MIKKAILFTLALGLLFGVHLRPRCDFELDGRTLALGCSPAAARRAEAAARAAAEEILPGPAAVPTLKRHVRFSFRAGDRESPQLSDTLLCSTPGVALRETVWVGDRCLGAVSDAAAFQAQLQDYLASTLPSWASGSMLGRPLRVVRCYSRDGYVSTAGDMVLLVTGAVPVFYYDNEGNYATA